MREPFTEYLLERLHRMAEKLPKPQWGQLDSPSLLLDAATEIERLRAYAIQLESIAIRAGHINVHTAINEARDETKVNWEAIHGVYP